MLSGEIKIREEKPLTPIKITVTLVLNELCETLCYQMLLVLSGF